MARLLRALAFISLALPGAAYLAVSLSWEHRHVSPVTGDEPHYLIIADAIARDHTVDVRRAYDRDALTRRISGPIDWQNHSRTGPNGTFSLHDIGLPILIAPAFATFGLAGVRVLLGVITGLVPFLIFAMARLRGVNWFEGIGLALAAAAGLPFLAASGQVYPDLVSGVVLLGLACVVMASHQRVLRLSTLLASGLLLALLPWLHIKNTVAAFVIAATIAVTQMRGGQPRSLTVRLASLSAPLLLSIALHAGYNVFAFGHVAGALDSADAAGATLRQTAMIFLGLHFDQLQGIFVEQPFFALGLIGLAVFWSRARVLAAGLTLGYLAIVIPNSLHPCWYGCWSMGGRFMWSIAALWCVPLIFLYGELRTFGRTVVMIAGGAAVALQIDLWQRWAHRGPMHLFSTLTPDLFERNSLVAGDWRRWLPSFVDFPTYSRIVPNYIAATLALGLVAAGLILIAGPWKSRSTPQAAALGPRSWLAAGGVLLCLVGAGRLAAQYRSIDLVGLFPSAETRPRGAGAETFGLREETIAGTSMPAIFAHAPSRITWTVVIPEDAVLTTSLGIDPSAWDPDGDGVVFRIAISDDSGYKEFVRQLVDPHAEPGDRRWIPVAVDLSVYSGRRIQIIFNADTSPAGSNDSRNDLSFWGRPVIRSGS